MRLKTAAHPCVYRGGRRQSKTSQDGNRMVSRGARDINMFMVPLFTNNPWAVHHLIDDALVHSIIQPKATALLDLNF